MAVKDIIKITLFAVVGFIVSIIGGYTSALFGPNAMFIHASIGALLAGPVFAVMCHRVKRFGAAFIYYLLAGIVYAVMGMWPMLLVNLAAAAAAEAVLLGRGSYEKPFKIGVSYVLAEFIYSLHGFFFIVFIGIQGLVKQFPTMFTEETARGAADFYFNPKNLVIVIAIQLTLSILGALFGNYIYNKFFTGKEKEKKLLN